MYKDILGFDIDTSEPLPECYTEECEWNCMGCCNFDVLAYYCFEITTKEKNKVKVRDLIEKLERLDPNMDVWGSMNVENRHYPAINYNPKKVVVLREN